MYSRGVGSSLDIDATEKFPAEGGAPAELTWRLIDRAKSPVWAKMDEVGPVKYLGVDLSKWKEGKGSMTRWESGV